MTALLETTYSVGDRVRIANPCHPHYLDAGRLTDKTVHTSRLGMVMVDLDACRHSPSAGQCYVEPHEVRKL